MDVSFIRTPPGIYSELFSVLSTASFFLLMLRTIRLSKSQNIPAKENISESFAMRSPSEVGTTAAPECRVARRTRQGAARYRRER